MGLFADVGTAGRDRGKTRQLWSGVDDPWGLWRQKIESDKALRGGTEEEREGVDEILEVFRGWRERYGNAQGKEQVLRYEPKPEPSAEAYELSALYFCTVCKRPYWESAENHASGESHRKALAGESLIEGHRILQSGTGDASEVAGRSGTLGDRHVLVHEPQPGPSTRKSSSRGLTYCEVCDRLYGGSGEKHVAKRTHQRRVLAAEPLIEERRNGKTSGVAESSRSEDAQVLRHQLTPEPLAGENSSSGWSFCTVCKRTYGGPTATHAAGKKHRRALATEPLIEEDGILRTATDESSKPAGRREKSVDAPVLVCEPTSEIEKYDSFSTVCQRSYKGLQETHALGRAHGSALMDAADPSRWREEIEKSRALHAGSKEESDGVGRLLGMIDDLKMFGQEPVAGPDGPCISIPEVSCAPALTRPEVSCAPAPAPRAPTRPEASCAPAPAPASTRLEVVPNHPAATSDGESANKVEIRTASADELTTPSDNNLPSSNKEKASNGHHGPHPNTPCDRDHPGPSAEQGPSSPAYGEGESENEANDEEAAGESSEAQEYRELIGYLGNPEEHSESESDNESSGTIVPKPKPSNRTTRECARCGFLYLPHCRDFHTQPKPHVCGDCKTPVPSQCDFISHLQTCPKEGFVKVKPNPSHTMVTEAPQALHGCSVCVSAWGNLKTRQKHIQSIPPENCRCGTVFSTRCEGHAHQRTCTHKHKQNIQSTSVLELAFKDCPAFPSVHEPIQSAVPHTEALAASQSESAEQMAPTTEPRTTQPRTYYCAACELTFLSIADKKSHHEFQSKRKKSWPVCSGAGCNEKRQNHCQLVIHEKKCTKVKGKAPETQPVEEEAVPAASVQETIDSAATHPHALDAAGQSETLEKAFSTVQHKTPQYRCAVCKLTFLSKGDKKAHSQFSSGPLSELVCSGTGCNERQQTECQMAIHERRCSKVKRKAPENPYAEEIPAPKEPAVHVKQRQNLQNTPGVVTSESAREPVIMTEQDKTPKKFSWMVCGTCDGYFSSIGGYRLHLSKPCQPLRRGKDLEVDVTMSPTYAGITGPSTPRTPAPAPITTSVYTPTPAPRASASTATRVSAATAFLAPAPSTEFRCCDCGQTFKSAKKLRKHSVNLCKITRWLTTCRICNKAFKTSAIFDSHKCRKVQCLGPSCSRRFYEIAHMIDHLESGGCTSKLDRHKINKIIADNDRSHTLTIPGAQAMNSIGSGSFSTPPRALSPAPAAVYPDDPDYDSDIEEIIFTPSTTSGIRTPASGYSTLTPGLLTPTSGYFALTPAFPFPTDSKTCSICGTRFSSKKAASQHMASPVHDAPRYCCPSDSFFEQLGLDVPSETVKHQRVFKTLAGLVLHLDTGKCRNKEGGQKAVWALVERLGGRWLLGN